MSDGQFPDRRLAVAIVGLCLVVVVAGVGATLFWVTGGSPSSAAATQQVDVPEGGEVNVSAANATVVGNDSNNVGYDVAAAGDVNGDGHEDLLVSTPFDDTNGPNAGAAYLFYGPVEDEPLNVSEADVSFVGARGDRAGWAVAAGDVTGDDVDDLVIGAPQNDTNGPNSGAAYVVSGGATWDGVVVLPTAANATYYGAGDRDLAGRDVATVERNGSDAVLVGAPFNDSAASDAGAAYLVRNASEGEHDLVDAAAARYLGASDEDRAGWAVADAGDVTGDGSHEVVVGAPRNDSAAFNAGAAYVLAANRSGEVPVDGGLVLRGVGASDRAGWAVSAAGDVNNDSSGDVVVGAPYNDSVGNDSGAAYVVTGAEDLEGSMALSNASVVLSGENATDRAGWAVAPAGSVDPDCDDYDDVLVGAPYNDSTAPNAGAAYIVFGGPEGVRNLSEAGTKLRGETEGDLAGWAVAGANNSTGTGKMGVIVGAPGNETDGNESGAAYLLEVDCPDEETPTDSPTDSATPSPTASPTRTDSPAPTDSPAGTDSPAPTDSPTRTDSPSPTSSPTPTGTPSPTASPTPEDSPAPTESPEPTDSPRPTESPQPTETATESPTPTPTPDDLPVIDIEHPTGEPTVRPDTPVWFEAAADVPAHEVAWRAYERGEEPGRFVPRGGPVQAAWPTALYRTTFDSAGTYVVEAAALADDGTVRSSVEWTVTVTDDAPEPPTREPISPVGETLYLEETTTWTVGIEGGDAPYRVGWWLAQCDLVHAVDTTRNTSSIEYPNSDAAECMPWPVAIDANGMSTGISGPGWDVTFEEPLAVEIVDTGTNGEVVAEVTNVGTEPHDAAVQLELEEDARFTAVDSTDLSLGSGETERVTLEYDDDRETVDVRVTARTGGTTVNDAATVRLDGGSTDGGTAGNDGTDTRASLPVFRLGWATGSLALIAGLVGRRN